MTAGSFTGHFESRRHYQLNHSQAWYANQDTGVYFSFEFNPRTEPPEDGVSGEEGEPADDCRPSVASFNMNYNRPSFFGHEAAPEIAAFVGKFDLIVDDPQIGGMSSGVFSPESFISGWSMSNEWACSAIREDATEEPPLTYPREALLRIWRWNLGRADLQSQFGERVFVPKISFAVREAQVHSFAVWPDAIPAVLPQVDDVVIVRDELARRRWYLRKPIETLSAPWDNIDSVLQRATRSEYPIRHIYLDYVDPPTYVVELVKRDWPAITKKTFRAVGPDTVLDAEFFKA